MNVRILVYDATAIRKLARDRTFDPIVADLFKNGVTDFYIEQDDSLVHSDTRAIHQARNRHGAYDLRFTHVRSTSELLLSIPDAIGWCYGKNKEWRREVDGLITEIRTIDP